MEIKFKKSLVSLFEMTFSIILLFSFLAYFGFFLNENTQGLHKLQVDTFFDSLFYIDNYRNTFMSENLSLSSITANWTNISRILNVSFRNYSLTIFNETTSKIIFSCNATTGKEITEKFIAIKDNQTYEFRWINFGVCY